MILKVNYEEMLALRAGVRAILGGGPTAAVAVASPPEDRAAVQALPALDGDLSVETLGDLAGLEAGVEAVTTALHARMDADILATHPASEEAVASYFDYAHARAVLGRIRVMRGEMEDVIELVTGGSSDDELLRTFVFPD